VAILPTINATKLLLDELTFPRRRGNSVPMSSIGDNCARRLWLGLHWAVKSGGMSLRIKNLFATGTKAEDFIIKDLERIGIKVTKRQEEITGFMGHARGFTDGRCENVPEAPKTEHLLEMKTHNEKYFKILIRDGVKKGFPKHYAQCHRYMKGLGLKRTLYAGYNKNTSEYYIERIHYDSGFADDLIRKEQNIIASPTAPTKQFERSWFECKFCAFIGVCHDQEPLDKNCRTCEHSDLGEEGKWFCTFLEGEQHEIPKSVQETGCEHYKAIEI
jgi:hypothetical protein